MSRTEKRYEVFKRDSERKVHEAVGSVHAEDAELALHHARNVFVRRPAAVSLWVVRAEAVLSVTAQELQRGWLEAHELDGIAPEAISQRFLVFTKASQRRSMTFVKYVGEVMGRTAVEGLQKALADPDTFSPKRVLVWWVVPQDAILRSEDIEAVAEAWFEPAKEKTYRQQSYYGFVGSRRGRGKRRDE